jgi:hypothetical protein
MPSIESRVEKLESALPDPAVANDQAAEVQRWQDYADRMAPLLGKRELANVTAFLVRYLDPEFGLVHGPIFPPARDYRRHLPALLLEWIEAATAEERAAALGGNGWALGLWDYSQPPPSPRPDWLCDQLIRAAQEMDDQVRKDDGSCPA